MRTGEVGGLAVSLYEPIENQHQRSCDEPNVHGAKRRAREAIADTGLLPDGFVERHSRKLSEQHADGEKNAKEQQRALRLRRAGRAADHRRHQRHDP